MLSWSLPLAGEPEPLHGDGFVLVGDAAGLVDPFWGHGIDSAMVSGRFAAMAVAEALSRGDSDGDALARYSKSVHDYYDSTWQGRRGLRSQIRVLNSLLGITTESSVQAERGSLARPRVRGLAPELGR
jgi:flavin-dependent dehydrogenase